MSMLEYSKAAGYTHRALTYAYLKIFCNYKKFKNTNR